MSLNPLDTRDFILNFTRPLTHSISRFFEAWELLKGRSRDYCELTLTSGPVLTSIWTKILMVASPVFNDRAIPDCTFALSRSYSALLSHTKSHYRVRVIVCLPVKLQRHSQTHRCHTFFLCLSHDIIVSQLVWFCLVTLPWFVFLSWKFYFTRITWKYGHGLFFTLGYVATKDTKCLFNRRQESNRQSRSW